MPKKNQQPTLSCDQVLEQVAAFIRTLHPASESFDATPMLFFSTQEDGGLSLDAQEARTYRDCLAALKDLPNIAHLMSDKALERRLQQAILASLDPAKRRTETTFEDRLTEARETLKTQLQTKPILFEVFCPVAGLSSDGLPQEIGAVSFCVFDDTQRVPFDDLAKDLEPGTLMAEPLLDDAIGRSYGSVHVTAHDSAMARLLALRIIRVTIDVLNFYSDMVTRPRVQVYLPGDTTTTSALFPILMHASKLQSRFHWVAMGPWAEMSLRTLREVDATHHLGVDTISAILAKDNRTPLEERLLAAMQWAGRATVDPRNEEAFLLYAIALESLILMEDNKEELLYRLSLRVAHLLGADVASRQEIAKDVKRLYGIRSKIVHSGTYEVLDTDLSLLRWMTKNCIVVLLHHQPFRNMTSPDDLREWFDDRILSSTA